MRVNQRSSIGYGTLEKRSWNRPTWRMIAIAALVVTVSQAIVTRVFATPLSWTVSQGQSTFTMQIPDQVISGLGTLQVRNQTGTSTSWTSGNVSSVAGTINTDFTPGTSIEFLTNPAGSLYGLNTGNYRPNPASFNPANTNAANPNGQFSNTTSAPAVLGAKLRGAVGSFATDVAFFAARNVNYDVTSAVAPILGNSFSTSTISVSATALVDYDGIVAPVLGQILPDFSQQSMTLYGGSNIAGPGTINDLGGGLLRMTIPVSLTVPILSGAGTALQGTITGQIVAIADAGGSLISSPANGYLAGIGSHGNLFANGIGFERVSDGYDPIKPYTPREGWGVSAGTTAGVDDPSFDGVNHLVPNGSSFDAHSGHTSSILNDGVNNLLKIDQAFSFADENVLKIEGTVKNISGAAQDVLFTRNVDWDILPDFDNKQSTASAKSGFVSDISTSGFENANPLAAFLNSTGGLPTITGFSDNGGALKLDLGHLLNGQSHNFVFLYALSRPGQTETELRNQLLAMHSLDALVSGVGTNGLYSMAIGVYDAGVAAPEPQSWVLAGFGAAIVGLTVRRKRR